MEVAKAEAPVAGELQHRPRQSEGLEGVAALPQPRPLGVRAEAKVEMAGVVEAAVGAATEEAEVVEEAEVAGAARWQAAKLGQRCQEAVYNNSKPNKWLIQIVILSGTRPQ